VAYRHDMWVRYAEVDQQGVVFNSHYLAYVDEAMSHWMRSVGWDYGKPQWDFMVRHAAIDWRGSASYGDVVSISCEVERWGSTSFDVGFGISVGERTIVQVTVTYVGVDPATQRKAEVPTSFRDALSSS
jgi:acyl-CoA thioester hydrolase